MKESSTEKSGNKNISPQTHQEDTPAPGGPAYRYHGIPEKELREMIGISRRFFRIAADLSVTPN